MKTSSNWYEGHGHTLFLDSKWMRSKEHAYECFHSPFLSLVMPLPSCDGLSRFVIC